MSRRRSQLMMGLVIALLSACASGTSSSTGGEAASSPHVASQPVGDGPLIDLPITRATVPSTGLCRVLVVEGTRIQSFRDSACDGVEYGAETGSYIMFRSKRNRNEVYLCRMSTSERGVIDGIDVYNYARLRLIRVVLPMARRTSEDTMTCAAAEWS